MKSNKFTYNKTLSQVFLANNHYLDKISNKIDLHGKQVVEIGPGSGNITKIILEQSPRHLTMIEIDQNAIKHLQERFFDNNFIIIDGDCLEYDFDTDIIISNLPFHITNEFLMHLFLNAKFNICFLILQKEVANKLIALPGSKDYCALTVILGLIFDIKILINIPANAFWPIPKVDGAFVEIRPKSTDYIQQYLTNFDLSIKIKLQSFIRQLFQYRNKKIQNILSFQISEDLINLRPIHLSVADFINIFSQLPGNR